MASKCVGMAAMCKASMECATKDIPVISEPKWDPQIPDQIQHIPELHKQLLLEKPKTFLKLWPESLW